MNGATVYLAGKITGDADYRAKFAAARRTLESYGLIVLDPSFLPSEGLEYEAYLGIGMAMLDACACVCLLPDWRESNGARLEFERATAAGKTVRLFDDYCRIYGDHGGGDNGGAG